MIDVFSWYSEELPDLSVSKKKCIHLLKKDLKEREEKGGERKE